MYFFKKSKNPNSTSETSLVSSNATVTSKSSNGYASFMPPDFERLATVDVVRFTKEISESSSPRFIRGDARGDGRLNLSDAVTVLLHLFRGQSLRCRDAADVDDDGAIEIDDVLGILEYLFLLGQAPQPPFPMPGRDPSEDDLDCEG